MDFMPIFCDLKGKLCLIAGGGNIAAHKARLLLKAQAQLIIISPNFNDQLLELAPNPDVTLVQDYFHEKWLAKCWLAVAATDDPQVNQEIYASATERQIFCNVIDDAQRTSFITPAVIDQSPILIALTTGGNAPVLSQLLRKEIESTLSSSANGTLATLAGYLRQRIKNHFPDTDNKRKFWLSFFTDPMLIAAVKHQDTLAIGWHINRLMREAEEITSQNVYSA
ncbi:MAG: siroheme synthase [Enterobacteriaceae bacterium]|jgi:uroporphyrin-III C-methyltransferase/precorrin-2 dehydrogenase/sirohydrochlorin ferrochelatase|nr:siroheme synthase [Enterobacteriaceae bacterium]